MPFAIPNFGTSSGIRQGQTALIGSLGAFSLPGTDFTIIGANISATAPVFGAFSTIVSAGFNAGLPRQGNSMLLVVADGIAVTDRAIAASAPGSISSAEAELSITIEEWTFSKGPRGVPRSSRLVRSITFNPTILFNDETNPIIPAWQERIEDGTPFIAAAGMPVLPLHRYVCIVNLAQTASASGVSPAFAGSNVQFQLNPVSFNFI